MIKISFRRFLRNRALDFLGLISKPANGIHILNGHIISRNDPSKEIFFSLLKEINKFSTLIRIEEAIELIKRKVIVNQPLIAFTFDDGFEECETMIAPVLEHFDINGLFFINPNFVEGSKEYIANFTENIVKTPGKLPMNWNQINKLILNGHLIGAHTMDHYMLNSNDQKTLQYQIVECKSVIEKHIGHTIEHFAFPYGRLDQINELSLNIALSNYDYVFSQSDYKNYYSFEGRVINRRHFEPNWPVKHVKYFLSTEKKF